MDDAVHYDPGLDPKRWLINIGVAVLAIIITLIVIHHVFSFSFHSPCGCAFPDCGNGTLFGDPCRFFSGGAARMDFNVTFWVNGTEYRLVCTWNPITHGYWWWLYANGSLVVACLYVGEGFSGCCRINTTQHIVPLPNMVVRR